MSIHFYIISNRPASWLGGQTMKSERTCGGIGKDIISNKKVTHI